MFWFIVIVATVVGYVIWQKKKREKLDRDIEESRRQSEEKCEKLVAEGASCESCWHKNSDKVMYCTISSDYKRRYGVCSFYDGRGKHSG